MTANSVSMESHNYRLVFTSCCTRTGDDPTAEEQSAEEIKNEVSRHSGPHTLSVSSGRRASRVTARDARIRQSAVSASGAHILEVKQIKNKKIKRVCRNLTSGTNVASK